MKKWIHNSIDKFLKIESAVTREDPKPDVSLDEQMRQIQDANAIIKASIRLVNGNFSVWARPLSALNIYCSFALADEGCKTASTDGLSIAFYPPFVLEQLQSSRDNPRIRPAITFVLIHEILHCLNRHHERMAELKADPYIWNIAADFAINPIIASSADIDIKSLPKDGKPLGQLAWPMSEGKVVGLYKANEISEKFGENDFLGLSAEQIYYKIIEELEKGKKKKIPGIPDDIPGRVQKRRLPGPDGPVVQKGFNPTGTDEAKPEDKKGDGSGDKDAEKRGNEKAEDKGLMPSIGDQVRLNDGSIGIVKVVHPNGDIEV